VQYDVALSYAGEDRGQARELAKLIQTAGYLVFYDEFEVLWGEDLSVKLHEVYEKQSRYCVLFVSKHYLNKPWTNVERKAVLARAMQQETRYLLPIRLDDSELPGLPGVTGYMDLRQNSLQKIFESLKRILGPPPSAVVQPLVERRRDDAIVRMHPRNFLGIVVQKDTLEAPWFNLDCHLINESRQPARVQRLEALVTPSGKRGIPFAWNLFYEFLPGGRVMEKTADAAAIELGPEASRMLGVQFLGPRLSWELQWPVGQYEIDILGWVNRGPREPAADLRTRFKVQVSFQDWQWLNVWAGAPEAAWEQLNDPHNAVAIPVTIEQATLEVG
jgi:TIR domain